MSVDLHVHGVRPPDDEWKKMKAVWEACLAANVDVPAEVDEFFEGERPDPTGVVVELRSSVTEWKDDYRRGFEIDVTKLPSGVKIVRAFLA